MMSTPTVIDIHVTDKTESALQHDDDPQEKHEKQPSLLPQLLFVIMALVLFFLFFHTHTPASCNNYHVMHPWMNAEIQKLKDSYSLMENKTRKLFKRIMELERDADRSSVESEINSLQRLYWNVSKNLHEDIVRYTEKIEDELALKLDSYDTELSETPSEDSLGKPKAVEEHEAIEKLHEKALVDHSQESLFKHSEDTQPMSFEEIVKKYSREKILIVTSKEDPVNISGDSLSKKEPVRKGEVVERNKEATSKKETGRGPSGKGRNTERSICDKSELKEIVIKAAARRKGYLMKQKEIVNQAQEKFGGSFTARYRLNGNDVFIYILYLGFNGDSCQVEIRYRRDDEITIYVSL